MRFRLFFVMLFILFAHSICFADAIDIQSTPADGTVIYKWRLESVSKTGTTTRGDSKHLFYVGYPAEHDGEQDVSATSVSFAVTKSGTFQFPIVKIKAMAGITVSIGSDMTLAVERSSRPLKKGEYIEAYYTRNWERWTAKQVKEKATTRYTFDSNGNPTGIYTDVEVVETVYGYLYKPILPKVTLIYKNSQ